MNKLKKPIPNAPAAAGQTHWHGQYGAPVAVSNPPLSRTMMYARGMVSSSDTSAVSPIRPAIVTAPAVQPTTTTEQYWAARALTAEAFLSASAVHESKMHAVISAGEVKRSCEMAALQHSYDERHGKLERLVVKWFPLMRCLMAAVSAILYITSYSLGPVHSRRLSPPSHFTIPILSPFASVVEHETSVVNFKLIAVCALFLSILAYACFRYWLAHAQHR